jgi:4,5-DOPA dioxygenase extradiol
MHNVPEQMMPTVFIGHGNPMHALQDDPFTRALRQLGQDLPRPQAILCISAHWMTTGSWVTGMMHPRTIHDFSGFPPELSAVQYPAPGDPSLAALLQKRILAPPLHIDAQAWGLDHGTWSVLRHMFPAADIPVLQLSLDCAQSPEYHFELGQQLRQLRRDGVLILGSGNIVHNLRMVDFHADAPPYDWAVAFDSWVKERIVARDFPALLSQAMQSKAARLSIPTPDHWYPLLYILGAAEEHDALAWEYEGFELSAISIRCLSFGR